MNDVVDEKERIAALAEELRASGGIGRSDVVNRLFGFLLNQSLAGRSPKEIEVAQEVFGKDADYDMAQDASVRVHIHRLRKKLDEVYAGRQGERLTIPRGEYRLAVERAGAATAELEAPAGEASAADAGKQRQRRFALPGWRTALAFGAALALGVAIGAALWAGGRAGRADTLADTGFWRPLASSKRPTMVVAGDYYLIGEAPNSIQVTRLVREFAINSREDLDEFLMMHPDYYGRYVNLDLHYLPVSAANALRDVIPQLDGLSAAAGAPKPSVITMSRLTPDTLKSANIVYVGFLSGLGLLRDPVFEASGFSIGASYDELIDRASGKHYLSDWEQVTENRTPRRDYAYLASLPGPQGNRILVVAGTRDAAVAQAGEIASDRAQLAAVAAQAGNAAGFEALFEVRTLGNLNLGSSLVVARPVKLEGLWRAGAAPGRFPDQMQTPDAPETPAAGQ